MDIHMVPNMLMLVGLASVGINLCAGRICQDSMDVARFTRWKNFLTPFFMVSLLFTSLLLVAMSLSYALQPSLEESLKIGLKNGIRFYKVEAFNQFNPCIINSVGPGLCSINAVYVIKRA